MSLTYCVVTPAKDEEDNIVRTLESMVAQHLKPLRWIIVDDASRDSTGKLVSDYASRHDWISLVRRESDQGRRAGAGVIEAFYHGLKCLVDVKADVIVKLDADLSFEPDFFLRMLEKFEVNPQLGLAGGVIYLRRRNKVFRERVSPIHIRGATKCYRWACFEQIGGLYRGLGWDTIDEVKAEMHGWEIAGFEDLRVVQHRETGASTGLLKRWWM